MGYSRRMQGGWLTDVRKLALLNASFSFLSVLVPTRRFIATVSTITTDHHYWWLVVMLALAVTLFNALVLTFFWALYRDRSRIALPARLRLIALGAAIVMLVIGFAVLGNGLSVFVTIGHS